MSYRSITMAALLTSAMAFAPALSAARQEDQTADHNTSRFDISVEIDGVDAGHFSEISGLSIEQEVIEYQNGDDPLVRKRPGRVKYGNITLKRGYVTSSVLNDWIEAARIGNSEYMRKNLSIIVSDREGLQLKRFNLFECFPISWDLSPLDDSGGKESVVETFVIAVEWFEEA